MKLIRKVKKRIKRILLFICKLNKQIYNNFHIVETAMPQGNELQVDLTLLHKIDSKYGDWLIHPCVRYIPYGFAGHKWWMVCTPYPNFNSYYENPVLFCGDGDAFPTKWNFVAVVQESHRKGYNADGCLYFDNQKLWILWKEAETTNTDALYGYKAIMGKYYDGKSFSSPCVVCNNIDDTNMYLASPSILNIDNQVKLLAVFTPNSYQPIPNIKKGPRHLAVFDAKKEDEDWKCQFEGIFHQGYPKDFDFWHIDTFSYEDKYYCLVTPEAADCILLGESKDGLHFKFYEKPLLHANGREKTPYTYKVSGLVLDNIFYLIYPMRTKDNVVRLHVTKMNFKELLYKLKNK